MHNIDIVRIPEIENKLDGIYEIYALSIDNKSLAVSGLEKIKQNDISQYKKILAALKMIANYKKDFINDISRVVRGKGYTEIYELKAKRKNARLFVFYDDSESKMIICTNTYWKTGDNENDRRNQTKQFQLSDEMRKLYFTNKGETK